MTDNPYAASEIPDPQVSRDWATPRRVQIRPLARLNEAIALMGDQYLLFVGICFVALLINAVVPMNVLLGPLLCGLHMCFHDRALGQATQFERLFKGFDFFLPSFLATLVMMLIMMLVTIPLILFMVSVPLIVGAATDGNEEAMGMVMLFGIVPMILVFAVVSLAFYIPFLFAFALIVDRKLEVMDALKTSWAGARKNFWGLFGMSIVYGLLGMLCVLMCYIPFFFFMPIQAGAYFLLYREIFPDASLDHAQAVEVLSV